MDAKEVEVTILDRTYRLRANAGDEQYLQSAAALINRLADEYGKRFAHSDKQDLLAMASLGPITELQKLQAKPPAPSDDRLQGRLKQINDLFSN
ncbi:MAG: cell division protein ZapA [Bacteroidales bacterium]|nr:cell division protein ZapA [Bacteroidales bacterium]